MQTVSTVWPISTPTEVRTLTKMVWYDAFDSVRQLVCADSISDKNVIGRSTIAYTADENTPMEEEHCAKQDFEDGLLSPPPTAHGLQADSKDVEYSNKKSS